MRTNRVAAVRFPLLALLSAGIVLCSTLLPSTNALAQAPEDGVTHIKVIDDDGTLIESVIVKKNLSGPDERFYAENGEWADNEPMPCAVGERLLAVPRERAYLNSREEPCHNSHFVELKVTIRRVVGNLIEGGIVALSKGQSELAMHAFADLAARGDFPTHELGPYISRISSSEEDTVLEYDNQPIDYWNSLRTLWEALAAQQGGASSIEPWNGLNDRDVREWILENTTDNLSVSSQIWGYGVDVGELTSGYVTAWSEPRDWYSVQAEGQEYWTPSDAQLGPVIQLTRNASRAFVVSADMAVKALIAQALPLDNLTNVDFLSFMKANQSVSGQRLARNVSIIFLANALQVPQGAQYDDMLGEYALSLDLVDQLIAFQSNSGLAATGELDNATLEALSGVSREDLLHGN